MAASRLGRLDVVLITTVMALVVAFAPAPASAEAIVDTDVADFPAGGSLWAIEPGVVERRPALLSENFDGTSLPATLVASAAGATVGSGALTVSNAQVYTSGFSTATQTLEFRATFGADERQHIGFAGPTNLNQGPWAIFSTGGPDDPAPLRARTHVNATTGVSFGLAGVDPTEPHTYRIEWGSTTVEYFVDGVLKATHAAPLAQMRPIASDGSDPAILRVDWLAQGEATGTAVFESRVHDAGDPRVYWGAITTAPDVALETRSGDVPTPDGTWSEWHTTGSADTIRSPRKRYMQYRATLTDDDPTLDDVQITYHIDNVAPTAVIGGVQVWDGDATVSFSTPDPDIDDFQCSIDYGEFAWCASPFVFRNLATGMHNVRVRAHDEVGNVGAPASMDFAVDATPPRVVVGRPQVTGTQVTMSFGSQDADAQVFECSVDGGTFKTCSSPATFEGLAPGVHTVRVRARDTAGNTGPSDARGFSIKDPRGGPETEEDNTVPVIKLFGRRGTVYGRTVTVKVRCPAGEERCVLTMRAGSGPKKRATLGGGWTVRVSLKLTPAMRRKLAARGRLAVKIQIAARDAAGNRRTKKYPFTLLRPG